MHGNEPSGVAAIETVFQMLALEPIHNRSFRFRGRLVGLRGNRRALNERTRYLKKDLNRQWTPEHIAFVREQANGNLTAENLEQKELLSCIEDELRSYQPEQAILLDLHTTTATGGIFSISTDDPESTALATSMKAPVVNGLLKGISGTILHWFNRDIARCDTIGLAFESGQHDDPLSIKRSVAALINLLRGVGCVRAEDVETKHDELLQEYSMGLPAVTELVDVHRIQEGDNFVMQPGYQNFQPVVKGECLATDKNGPILAEADGLILMPLYQQQGDDGFFLIKPIEL